MAPANPYNRSDRQRGPSGRYSTTTMGEEALSTAGPGPVPYSEDLDHHELVDDDGYVHRPGGPPPRRPGGPPPRRPSSPNGRRPGSSNGSRPRTARERRRLRRARHKQVVRSRRTAIGRHPKLTALAIVLLLLSPVWVSLGSSMANPANGPFSSRFVEWVRENGGANLVASIENYWYTHHQPPKGGEPKKGAIPAPTKTTTLAATAGPPHLPTPPPITPIASPPIAGEGQWHPIGRDVGGIPAMYAAYIRPNAQYTSEVTGVAWMDTTLLKATLYEGSEIPGTGGPWTNTAPISATAANTLVAAFNSGFLMGDSEGGYYDQGQTAVPLRNGAASFVIYRNGTATVGTWGQEVTMTPNVQSVRQNLGLIVDNGQVVPGVNDPNFLEWGNTLGGAVRVWRSGIGVTANGALVWAGGSGLSIGDLANVLQRAGAVRGMETDINTSWVNFFSFDPAPGQPAAPSNGTTLTSDEVNSPSRYFAPCARDFITMSARVP